MPTKAVLFAVDVQNGFRNPASAPAIRRIGFLLRDLDHAGLPVIFTKYHNYPDSKFTDSWTERKSSTQRAPTSSTTLSRTCQKRSPC